MSNCGGMLFGETECKDAASYLFIYLFFGSINSSLILSAEIEKMFCYI